MARKILGYIAGKKSQTDALISATSAVVATLRLVDAYKVQYVDLVRTAWSDEERLAVEHAAEHIPQAQLVSIDIPAAGGFMLEHPALPPNATVSENMWFRISPPLGKVRFWPKSWYEHYAPINKIGGTLQQVCKDIIQDTLDRYAVRQALTALRHRCEFHEQAISLMPFWRNILHMAGYHELAEIPVERLPSQMPTLNEQDRRAIRHANTVLASHALLGTLDGSFKHQSQDNENCTVTLNGNQTIAFETDAGVEWRVYLEP